MNRFIWLVRREIWENKAIWIAPLIVLASLLVLVLTGNVHLGPDGGADLDDSLAALAPEKRLLLLLLVYAGIAMVMFLVMGIVAFFYSLDALYADRRDRSVLFWKSLPLSDAETVLAKFVVAACVIPLVAFAGAVLAQLLVAAGGSARLALAGAHMVNLWQPGVLGSAIGLGLLWSVTAMLWYAPVIAYLMLASAWATRGPFLWAVLPPAGVVVLERMVLRSHHAGDFVSERMLGLYRLLGTHNEHAATSADGGSAIGGQEAQGGVIRLADLDPAGALRDFYGSADLWLGLVAAGLLLGAAIWLRRYRDS